MKLSGPIFTFANAAMAAALYSCPRHSAEQLDQGIITLANASLLSQSTYLQPVTNYVVGYPGNDDAALLVNHMFPKVMVGERFSYKVQPVGEALLADPNEDAISSASSQFKVVSDTSTETDSSTVNRGLTKRVKRQDQVGDWLNQTALSLRRRIERNSGARGVALAVATGSATAVNWSSVTPDAGIRTLLQDSGDTSGLAPNRLVLSGGLWSARASAYSILSTPYSGVAALQTPEQFEAMLGLPKGGLLISQARAQQPADTKKEKILGSLIAAFYAQENLAKDDPSVFKNFWSPCEQGGGEWAVHVMEGPNGKFADVTVERYERLAVTASGLKKLAVSLS